MLNLIARLFIVALALLAAAAYIPGIGVSGFYIALIAAVILGILNLTIRPILYILTLPINLLTFGLFSFFINALLFWFVSTFVQGFEVEGILSALAGSIIVSLASWLSSKVGDTVRKREDDVYRPPRFMP